jgi:hypothetical protein
MTERVVKVVESLGEVFEARVEEAGDDSFDRQSG